MKFIVIISLLLTGLPSWVGEINLKELNNDNFIREISGKKLAVVIFSAPWCTQCREVKANIRDEVKPEFPEVTFGVYNILDGDEVKDEYGIRTVPVTIVFKNTRENKRFNGPVPLGKLKHLLREQSQEEEE